MKKSYALFLIFAGLVWSMTQAQTIVERHGQLKIEGTKVKDACNRNVQLKGMSYFWHQWEGKEYWNANTIKWLRDDWKVEIVRAAMGVRGGGGDYIDDPEGSVEQVRSVVNGAIQHGIYVIIDFHAHPNYKEQAKTFFKQMSKEFGNYPNVIYEIWNEPIGDYANAVGTWNEIKSYSREVIAEIRANDPDNIIVVGTPFYSQRVDTAADNPLTTDINNNPVSNIAYTIHAYAGAHKQSLRDKADYAINKGLALFMTECGRVGTNYGPNNNIDPEEWNRWENWMDANDISYCKWSLSNKNEISSSLKPSANANGNWNYNNDLTSEGKWNRDHFRSVNASVPSVCDTNGENFQDDIKSVETPAEVNQGGTASIKVNYSASTARDIRVAFQLNSSPYTVYGEKKVDVEKGEGSITVQVPISATTPVGQDAYQIQTFITTNNGAWENKLDNILKNNIDCIASSTGAIKVRARGTNGAQIEIRRNDNRIGDIISLGSDFQTYTISSNEINGNFKVAYINDDSGRDAEIDWLEINGNRIEAESREENTGAWNQTCGGGSFTQMLHCNGYINFGSTNSGLTGTIEIGAKGNCGGEKIQLMLDNEMVKEYTLTTDIEVYTFSNYSGAKNIKVAFTNDNTGNCDRNAYIDWIKVCGSVYQTENTAKRTGCGNSEWLYCNGNFDFSNVVCEKQQLDQEDIKVDFAVYPNPLQGNDLFIQGTGQFSIDIYDTGGRQVYQKNNLNSNLTLSTQSFSKGLYIVKVKLSGSNTNQIFKIIKN